MSDTGRGVALLSALVAAIWIVSCIGFVFSSLQFQLALVPRSFWHLSGVITMPLLHASFTHLIANSMPLIVFGGLLLLQGSRYLLRCICLVVVLGGLGLWVIGRSGAHIGASGLVFGLFGVLIARAYYQRSIEALLTAAVVMAFYGGIAWGILPTRDAVSWEGHLSGLLAGVATARLMSAGASASRRRSSGWGWHR